MLPEEREKCIDDAGPSLTSGSFADNMLLPEYRGHSATFWLSIQSIHDKWNERDEIIRREHAARLKKQYSND